MLEKNVDRLEKVTPIFVVGNVHSGTTLLQRSLSRHPAMFVGRGETQFYPNVGVIRNRFPDISNSEEREKFYLYLIYLYTNGFVSPTGFNADLARENALSDQLLAQVFQRCLKLGSSNQSHREVYVSVLESFAVENNKAFWVEKTPVHLFYVDKILADAPQARIIELVRDPRAILASKKARTNEAWIGARQKGHAVHAAGGYDPILHTLAWKSAVHQGNLVIHQYPESALRIQYEEFVSGPETTLRKICEFLDVDYFDEMLNVNVINSTATDRNPHSGISTQSVARWKSQLTEAEIWTCQYLAKKELAELNYEPASLHQLPVAVRIPRIIFGSGWELARMMYLRWRLRGMSYILSLVQNYRDRFLALNRAG